MEIISPLVRITEDIEMKEAEVKQEEVKPKFMVEYDSVKSYIGSHFKMPSLPQTEVSPNALPKNFFEIQASKNRRGRGYTYPVMDKSPEQKIVTQRSIFRAFKRFIRQHEIYLKALAQPQT